VAALVDVSKRFAGTPVLESVDLELLAGEILLIRGPSGTGKSTVVRLLLGLDTPDSGEVWLLGHRLAALGRRSRSALLREVGVGFQDPLLDGARSVMENVTGLARINGRFDDRSPDDLERLARITDGFGLAGLLERGAGALSGGQKLRVALGRALLVRPRVLLLDEPTHMVDPAGKRSIYDELCSLVREAGIAALIVSHDEEARAACDREVVVERRGVR
jgi:putative ABC transport system ATP-binding protein